MGKTLRDGFTTGTATAAATKAAVRLLAGGTLLPVEDVALPPFALEGNRPVYALADERRRLVVPVEAGGLPAVGCAWSSVIKDGGDDPDATHKARIIVYVSRSPFLPDAGAVFAGATAGVPLPQAVSGPVDLPGGDFRLYGGQGVGVVTLPGLPVAVGEPACNPEPRKQIAFAALEALEECGGSGPLHILVVVPDGEERSRRTMNARLGILGGISILGTRGTVKAYSHDAWKATIAQGLDVAAALGISRILYSTGRRSERLVFALYPDSPPQAGVQVADYAGFAVAEAAKRPVRHLVWACFPGKLLKLAQGLDWTHARSADADIALLARYWTEAGGSAEQAERIAAMPTAAGAFELMAAEPARHDAVLFRLARKAYAVLQAWLAGAGSDAALTLHVFSLSETLLLTLDEEAAANNSSAR